MTIEQLISKYENESFASLRGIIMSNTPESEEAAYYLLRYRMENTMRVLYNEYHLQDELADVLMDFQLYLRNGKAGNNTVPYQGIGGIMSMVSFGGWVRRTFRNYLYDRKDKETLEQDSAKHYETEGENLRELDEEKMRKTGIMIAWMVQKSSIDDRFLFFRHLLHTMTKEEVIPSKTMCTALGMSDGNYRTRISRINDKFLGLSTKLDNGENPQLDENYKELANEIYEQFDNITRIIKRLYEENLVLMSSKLKIQEVRKEDRRERGLGLDNIRFSKRSSSYTPDPSEQLLHMDYSDLSPRRYALSLLYDVLICE